MILKWKKSQRLTKQQLETWASTEMMKAARWSAFEFEMRRLYIYKFPPMSMVRLLLIGSAAIPPFIRALSNRSASLLSHSTAEIKKNSASAFVQ